VCRDSIEGKGEAMISDRLETDMKTAMKAGEKLKLSVIRMLRADLKNASISQGKDLSEAEEQKVLASYAKKRKESIDIYEKAGRQEMADKERAEYELVLAYLPQQISDDELAKIVKAKIEETAAKGPADMGKVMKAVMAQVGSSADGSAVSAMVKKTLLDGS
jgi:uncharacterized protein YqeY